MLHSMGCATVSARFHTSPTVLYLNTLKHTTIMSLCGSFDTYANHIWPQVCWKTSFPQAWLIRNAQSRPHPFSPSTAGRRPAGCLCVCARVCVRLCECAAQITAVHLSCKLKHHSFLQIFLFALQHHLIAPFSSLSRALTETKLLTS